MTIRGELHTIAEAVNRHFTHYAYHVGQITFIAKHFGAAKWKTLNVAHGRSGEYKEFLAMKQAETPVKTYRMDAPRGLRVVRLNRLNSVRTLIRNYALEQEFMKHRIRRIVGN